MLGAVGDILSGVGNTALSLVTFGQLGSFGGGLGQIGAGIGGMGNIIVRDMAATFAGVMGTVYTTVRDVVDVLSFGNVISGGNLIKALGNLVSNAIIPDYGAFGGKGWGTTQGRTPDMALNSVDYYSYIHDTELGVVPGANTAWVKNQWSPTPSSQAAPGLVGTAYVLAGTLPFLGADFGASLFGGP